MNKIIEAMQRAMTAATDARDAALALRGKGTSQDDVSRICLTINHIAAEQAYWEKRLEASM